MDDPTPSTGHGVAIVNLTEPVVPSAAEVKKAEIQARRAPLKPSVESHAQVKSEKKSGKAQPVVDSWKPSEYFQDAAWFAVHFGLPNEGETPHRISDVSEEQLSACFGEKTRNGFKLSTCTGIPVELILALTQVVDGYEKPVNGVLSHTFAKGAYAERVLKRKVNWVAYAATKLKGQLLQWEREGKGRPDGPPCIRKPRMYKAPVDEVCNPVPSVDSDNVKEGLPAPAVVSTDYGLVSWFGSTGSIPIAPSVSSEKILPSIPHFLLSIVESENSRMRARQSEICSSLSRVNASSAKFQTINEDIRSHEGKLLDMIMGLDADKADVDGKIASEELQTEELTTDIELESNKPCDEYTISTESGNEILALMEEQLENHRTVVDRLSRVSKEIQLELNNSHKLVAQKRGKLCTVPKTVAQLQAMSSALLREQSDVESNFFALQLELGVLLEVLSKPCPPLKPSFTVSSAVPILTQFSVSPCPVCCNGYHGFNWIPASCGHSYHPACLFPLMSVSKEAGPPKCRACGEVFSRHWLQTWGLECGTEVDPDYLGRHDAMTTMLKEKYGNSSSRLQQRRVLVQSLNAEVHAKGDIHVEAEECMADVLRGSLVVEIGDTGEDGSFGPGSEKKLQADEAGTFQVPGLSTPTQEAGDTPGKKRKAADVDTTKKVQRTELGIRFSPRATLPFSPETTTLFKPYMSIKSPCRDGPSLDASSTDVVTKQKKRLPL